MKRALILPLAILISAASLLAYPLVWTCPFDGEQAGIEQTIGSGKARVCSYGHQHYQDGKYVHHTFDFPCPD